MGAHTWTHIVRATAPEGMTEFAAGSESKISHEDLGTILACQDVLGLQVPMVDAATVASFYRI